MKLKHYTKWSLLRLFQEKEGRKDIIFYMLLLDCFTQIMKDKRNEEWKDVLMQNKN